jgi:hypothetical protein
MAILKKLNPGQVVYEVRRETLGNTTLKTTRVTRIHILEVIRGEGTRGHVIASWNGNKARPFYAAAVLKWHVNKPTLVKGRRSLQARIAKRVEIERARQAGVLLSRPDHDLIWSDDLDKLS